MSKHTKGPWRVRSGIEERFIDAENTVCLAIVNKCINNPKRAGEMQANAALIAAAPDMYEALKAAEELIKIVRQHFPKSMRNSDKFALENTCATIGKAIHKAKGKL